MQEQEMSQQASDEIATQFAQTLESSFSYLREDLDHLIILGAYGGDYMISPESGSHFNEIKTVVLPCLSRSLRRMQDLLTSPSYYQGGKDPDYQTGAKLLKEVEHTTDRLMHLNQSLLLQGQPRYFRGDWDMNAYRCRAMQLSIVDILRKTAEILRRTAQIPCYHRYLLSQNATLTMKKRDMEELSQITYHQTHFMLNSIDNIIRSFEPSDLELLGDRCRQAVQKIESEILHQVNDSIARARMHIQSSQDALTIIKLTRLFLNKLSKATNGIPHPLPLMSSDQLLDLIKATDHLDESLCSFMFFIPIEQPTGPRKAYNLLTQVLSAIKILTDYSGRQAPSPESPYDSPRKCCEWYQLFSYQLSAVVTRFTFPHLVQSQRE
ncbi:hypothetical protein PGT21_008572 [Puccinia graminis f. sp. tritici]|uniref:Uncharacterized protein n=1 Tax=Puccinia graminis f. sp. tritici TaxID=56615 RepID=A0A5B0Q2F3_PUCGR|nr:hypothetical protein PGT21_008572 [Puccinia graminis f. sp. tritici]KAA1124920.1 hypothetical protein PGTUg99_036730 [Puccinia graminis f. sp. tritici]